MSISKRLKKELRQNKTTLSALSRDKETKNRILDRLLDEGIKEGKSQAQIFREIRAEGFSFSNEIARNLYLRSTQYQSHKTSASYFRRLRRDVLPNVNRLLEVEFRKPQAEFYYGFRVYGVEKGKKHKPINRKVGAKRGATYTKSFEIGFYSDEILTKEQVEKEVRQAVRQGYSRNLIGGSDPNKLIGSSLKITHIKVIKLLRIA